MDTSKIKDRIQKLLNLANNDAAFEGEIENALRFARRLMLEHNVSSDDLDTPKDPHDIAAKTEYADAETYSFGKSLALWESWLMSSICKLIGTIGCYRTYQKTSKKTSQGTVKFDKFGNPETATKVIFYGPAEDVRDATEIFQEWVHTIVSMARLKYGTCLRKDGRSYCEGFVLGINKNLDNISREERHEISFQSTSKALVLKQANEVMTAKKNQAKIWLAREKGIKLGSWSRRGNHNDSGAFSSGFSDGQRANFSRAAVRKITY